MRLVQFRTGDGARRVGAVADDGVTALDGVDSVYRLAIY